MLVTLLYMTATPPPQVGMSRLSLKSIVRDASVRRFLSSLVGECVDLTDWSARLDFLATYMAEQVRHKRFKKL